MAAVRDVPDVTGKKMAIGARHRLCLRAPVSTQEAGSKPLSHATYAILCRLNKRLRWSDPTARPVVDIKRDTFLSDTNIFSHTLKRPFVPVKKCSF
jgi:hypothetical protein